MNTITSDYIIPFSYYIDFITPLSYYITPFGEIGTEYCSMMFNYFNFVKAIHLAEDELIAVQREEKLVREKLESCRLEVREQHDATGTKYS